MKTASALIAAGMLVAVVGTATAREIQIAPRNFLGFDHDRRFDGATWCGSALSGEEGTRECAFFSFQQCLETIRGLGGFCYPSPSAAAYDEPRVKRNKKARRHY